MADPGILQGGAAEFSSKKGGPAEFSSKKGVQPLTREQFVLQINIIFSKGRTPGALDLPLPLPLKFIYSGLGGGGGEGGYRPPPALNSACKKSQMELL